MMRTDEMRKATLRERLSDGIVAVGLCGLLVTCGVTRLVFWGGGWRSELSTADSKIDLGIDSRRLQALTKRSMRSRFGGWLGLCSGPLGFALARWAKAPVAT
jgi:hypothetical protein